jgi:hypothetical protein
VRRQVGFGTGVALIAALFLQLSALPAHATGSACTAPNLTSTAPQAPGAAVTFSATVGCTNPEFKFFLQQPNGAWVAQTPYGGSQWTLQTTGWVAGVYGVGVWAREQGSGAAYETYWIGTFALSLVTCDVTSFVFQAPFEPAPAGTPVSLTATATACSAPEYEFWVRRLDGTWHIGRVWGVSTWTWDTTGLGNGYYQVGVWARQRSSPNGYDAYSIRTWPIFPAVDGSCHEAGIAFSPADDGLTATAPGTDVQLAANSSCGPPVYYKWWLKPPDGSWQQSAYSQLTNARWATSGIAPGTYQVGLWATPSQSYPTVLTYGAYDIESYTLSVGRCSDAQIFPSGTANDIAAAARGCSNPEYQFWVLPPGASTWRMVQPYSSTNTYTVNTPGLAPGPYRVGVWVRQQGAATAYDSYAILTCWV